MSETAVERRLRDVAKALTLLGSPCPKNARGEDHEWHDCPRCGLLFELDTRGDSMARQMMREGATALLARCEGEK